MAKCGRWHSFIDPTTGGYKAFREACGLLHYCKRCQAKALEREHKRMNTAKSKQPGEQLYIAEVDPDNWETVSRRLRRHKIKVRRYPQEDGPDKIVLSGTDPSLETEPFDPFNADDLLDIIKQVPKKRNISGRLGYTSSGAGKVNDGDDAKTEKVQVYDVTCDATAQQRAAAWTKACTDTATLDPKTAKACGRAAKHRTLRYTHHLRKLGAKRVRVVNTYRHVRVSDIDWLSCYTEIRTLSSVPHGLKGPRIRLRVSPGG